MLDLSAIQNSKSNGKTKKALPVFDADDELKEMADEVARLAELESSSNTSKEILQAEIKARLRPFIFGLNSGKSVLQATVSLPGHKPETEILVALKDAYSTIADLKEITMIIGEARARRFFNQCFEIKLKSELIPEDSQQAIVDRITALLDEYGCKDALSASVKFKPSKAFATERHIALTVDENLALEGDGGITTMSVAQSRGRK